MAEARPKKFVAVRPYGVYIRRKMGEFLAEIGYELAVEGELSAGSTDEAALSWLLGKKYDLLLLPFHTHLDEEGRLVDGVGVAAQLGDEYAARSKQIPIVMPVSEYGWCSSFQRRFDGLRSACPELCRHIVIVRQNAIGDPEIAAEIERVAAGQRSGAARNVLASPAAVPTPRLDRGERPRATSVVYAYLRDSSRMERSFPDVSAAFDLACTHLITEDAVPIEIVREGKVLYELMDICELSHEWEAWRNGQGPHPVAA